MPSSTVLRIEWGTPFGVRRVTLFSGGAAHEFVVRFHGNTILYKAGTRVRESNGIFLLRVGALAFFGGACGIGVPLIFLINWLGASQIKIAPLITTATPIAVATSISYPTITLAPIFAKPKATSLPLTSIPQVSETQTPRAKSTLLQPTQTSRRVAGHFLFGRPLALDAPGPAPNWVYLYGTTELGAYEVHHGVDFDRNPIGTPIYAVGDGVVVSAGNDREPLCGADGKQVCGRTLNFYGLITAIRLNEKYRGQTLFALYAHQDRIDVKVGQRVKRGDAIGTVGMTGIAIGPHIQFEIRVGANDYASTRNPMVWIASLPGRGVIAGRYNDKDGNPIRGAIVDIYRADEPTKFYRETETYGADEQPDVNSDDELGENFLMSDLPAGDYIVRVVGKPFAARVTVSAGKLAWVEIGE